MAKKKSKNNSNSMIMKVVTLICSIIIFVFLFLEILVFKGKGNILGFNFSNSEDPETVSLSNFLFNEDYESLREELSTTTSILWIAFILVILSMIISLLSLFVKKQGSLLAKVSGFVLVVSMMALFIINLDKYTLDAGFLGNGELYLSNLTVMYFVSLAVSGVGLVSSLNLKK